MGKLQKTIASFAAAMSLGIATAGQTEQEIPVLTEVASESNFLNVFFTQAQQQLDKRASVKSARDFLTQNAKTLGADKYASIDLYAAAVSRQIALDETTLDSLQPETAKSCLVVFADNVLKQAKQYRNISNTSKMRFTELTKTALTLRQAPEKNEQKLASTTTEMAGCLGEMSGYSKVASGLIDISAASVMLSYTLAEPTPDKEVVANIRVTIKDHLERTAQNMENLTLTEGQVKKMIKAHPELKGADNATLKRVERQETMKPYVEKYLQQQKKTATVTGAQTAPNTTVTWNGRSR